MKEWNLIKTHNVKKLLKKNRNIKLRTSIVQTHWIKNLRMIFVHVSIIFFINTFLANTNILKSGPPKQEFLTNWFDQTLFSRDVGQRPRGSKVFFFLSLEEEWMRPRYWSSTVKIGGKILEEIKLIGQKNKLSRWI